MAELLLLHYRRRILSVEIFIGAKYATEWTPGGMVKGNGLAENIAESAPARFAVLNQ